MTGQRPLKGLSSCLLLVVLCCLSACRTASTSFVLLPDAEGRTGKITVATPTDSRVVDQPYASVSTTRSTNLSGISILKREDVDRNYADVLAAEPMTPAAFTIFFERNSTDLIERSSQQLQQIIEAVRRRVPTEVHVIGHTDTLGTDAVNDRLSLMRAQLVQRFLLENVPGLQSVTVRAFGSRDLLVPTPPGTDEPRNRRVEILVL